MKVVVTVWIRKGRQRKRLFIIERVGMCMLTNERESLSQMRMSSELRMSIVNQSITRNTGEPIGNDRVGAVNWCLP